MAKKICKLIKESHHDKHFDDYASLVKEPKYICKKCGHVAASEAHLCKPKKI